MRRTERDPPEALELLYGARDRARDVADIKLDDLVARELAGVLDIYGDLHRTGAEYLRLVHAEVREAECRVAEAVAERVKRRVRNVQVFRRVFFGFLYRAARAAVIVIERDLPDRARERDREFAAGVRVAEERVRDSGARHRAAIPRFEDGGRIFSDPVNGKRAAVHQNDGVRFSRGVDGLDEVELAAGKIEARTRRCLAREIGIFADGDYGEIGLARGVNGGLESGVGLAFQVAARGVTDADAGAELLTKSLEQGDGVFGAAVAGPRAVEALAFVTERADERDLVNRFRNRKRLVLVLQQDERFDGGHGDLAQHARRRAGGPWR